MRVFKDGGKLRVKAIAGTQVVLMALDMDEDAQEGLRGFAFRRRIVGSNEPPHWLTGWKYFEELVPHPDPNAKYSTREHPA
jgi:hypothetical protein